MAKTMTVVCLKCSCAQQRTVRKLFKGAFTCHRPQLYTNQVSRRSMQRQPRLPRDQSWGNLVTYNLSYVIFITFQVKSNISKLLFSQVICNLIILLSEVVLLFIYSSYVNSCFLNKKSVLHTCSLVTLSN